MDALERLAAPARDLFGRVDAALARAGAPDTHPIWPLLRRVGALPGDAVDAVLALRPAPLAGAGPPLRGLADEYERARHAVPLGEEWSGAGAHAFSGHWQPLAAHLAGADETLAGRLRETAAYADAVADWIAETRLALARTLADALGSTAAVALVTAPPTDGPAALGSGSGGGWLGAAPPVPLDAARAAAELGVRVLATVDEAYDGADRLRAAWSARLAELRYRPPTPDGPPPPNALRVPL